MPKGSPSARRLPGTDSALGILFAVGAVGAVIDGRLYLILLDAARAHYYPQALPDYEAMVRSAVRRR